SGTGLTIVVTFLLRAAVKWAANFVAEERRAKWRNDVGYVIYHDREVTKDTKIVFMTEGSLVKQLPRKDSPGAPGTLACKDGQKLCEHCIKHPDLPQKQPRVLTKHRSGYPGVCVTSATLPNPEEFRRHMSGVVFPPISGRPHSVDIVYEEGPSITPEEERNQALNEDPKVGRKIVVATNAAETFSRLRTLGVSSTRVLQRKSGSTPNTSRSLCGRLCSEAVYEEMPPTANPQSKRTDFALVALDVTMMGWSRAFSRRGRRMAALLLSPEDGAMFFAAIDGGCQFSTRNPPPIPIWTGIARVRWAPVCSKPIR
ncbi:ATP-dependent RNA helicase DHX8/PRP22, partial [Klebsormidium nitens]